LHFLSYVKRIFFFPSNVHNRLLEEEGYKIVEVKIPGIQKVSGSGVTKKNAKQAAAKFALRMISKTKYGGA